MKKICFFFLIGMIVFLSSCSIQTQTGKVVTGKMVSKGVIHEFSAKSNNWSAHIYEIKTDDSTKIKRYLELFNEGDEKVKDLKCDIIMDNYCLEIHMTEAAKENKSRHHKVEIVGINIDDFTPENENYLLKIHWNGITEELILKCK